LPSMASQGPSAISGLLGPLTSGMGGMNAASAASLAPEAAGASAVPGALGGAGGLGGGGSLVSGSSAATSFVRPASSFSPASAPTLPGGWQGGADKDGAVQTRQVGSGGLYGAPPPGAMGRDSSSAENEKPTRTLQVTARQGAGRGENRRI
jgi:hypothetical protein